MQLPLSPSQNDWMALIAIADHLHSNSAAPSLDGLATRLGLRGKVEARAELRRLAQLGWLAFHRNGRGIATRSMRLTPRGQAALETFRPIYNANLVRGTVELVLTRRQFEQARAAELPVDAFAQSLQRGKIVLRCLDWQERNFWGGKILRVLV